MRVLLQNFNRKNNKFEIGRQEIFYTSMKGLKDFLLKIPYDTSNSTIPIKIIIDNLIIEKLDLQHIRYEWNSFFTYRFIKRKKIVKIRELDQLLYTSKKGDYSKIIDIVLIALYFIVWILITIFNLASVQNFIILADTNKVVNIFFLWLIILSLVGFLNYFIKNILINISLYRKKFILEFRYNVIDDIKAIDITNLLLLISQYFYIIFIFYYFPNAYLRPQGYAMYISLLIIGMIIITQEMVQTFRDLYLNYKKKKNYLLTLNTLINYSKGENSITFLTLALNLKKLTLIDQRLWKILIGLLIFLLSLIPIL